MIYSVIILFQSSKKHQRNGHLVENSTYLENLNKIWVSKNESTESMFLQRRGLPILSHANCSCDFTLQLGMDQISPQWCSRERMKLCTQKKQVETDRTKRRQPEVKLWIVEWRYQQRIKCLKNCRTWKDNIEYKRKNKNSKK